MRSRTLVYARPKLGIDRMCVEGGFFLLSTFPAYNSNRRVRITHRCRFPPRRTGLKPRSNHVGFVVKKVALEQVFSQYFGFPCQFSFHRLLHTHRLSSGAGTIGQLVADVLSGLSLTPPKQKLNKTRCLHNIQWPVNNYQSALFLSKAIKYRDFFRRSFDEKLRVSHTRLGRSEFGVSLPQPLLNLQILILYILFYDFPRPLVENSEIVFQNCTWSPPMIFIYIKIHYQHSISSETTSM
jgi:hypothetical protein